MAGTYLNEPGYEIPKNKILIVPLSENHDGYYKDIIEPLKGKVTRDWFNNHFYYCLPLNIGNQYGFVIKSLRNFDMTWDGSTHNKNDVTFNFHDNENSEKQDIHGGFAEGVVTIQNCFTLRTPTGINLMTIQPPNMYIPGTSALTGVIESDQLRRDFTFNLKLTMPNYKITVKKGDPLGAFIPIPRYFVDNFEIDTIENLFSKEVHQNEIKDQQEFGRQRMSEDKEKAHESGRKYFNGIHAFGDKYQDHQKRIKD